MKKYPTLEQLRLLGGATDTNAWFRAHPEIARIVLPIFDRTNTTMDRLSHNVDATVDRLLQGTAEADVRKAYESDICAPDPDEIITDPRKVRGE